MVAGFKTTCATKIVSSNPVHGEMYSIQHDVIKFVNDWFSLVSPTNKTDRHDITEILLKVALNTLTQLNKEKPILGDFGSIYKGETYNLHHMQEQI
jgi:hypothetical protein